MEEKIPDLYEVSEGIEDAYRTAIGLAGRFAQLETPLSDCESILKELREEIDEAKQWDLLSFRQARLVVRGAEDEALLHFENNRFPTGGHYPSHHDAALRFASDFCDTAEDWLENWELYKDQRVKCRSEEMGWAAIHGINVTKLDKYPKVSDLVGWYASLCLYEDLFFAAMQCEFAATGAKRDLQSPRRAKFSPSPCPECRGQVRVTCTVRRTRYVSCKNKKCGWTGKEIGP